MPRQSRRRTRSRSSSREAGGLERAFRIGEKTRAMRGLDHAVQEVVQPVRLDAAHEVERIRAGELLDAGQLPRRVVARARDRRADRRRRRRPRRSPWRCRSSTAGSRCGAGSGSRRHRAAHHQPHDDLGAFEAAARRVLRVRHLGERSGSRSKRSMNSASHSGLLKPARSPCTWCDSPPVATIATSDVLGIALDRAPQRLPEPVAAARRGNRELQHADLQRHDRRRPLRARAAASSTAARSSRGRARGLEERHVELVGHQRGAEVPRRARDGRAPAAARARRRPRRRPRTTRRCRARTPNSGRRRTT